MLRKRRAPSKASPSVKAAADRAEKRAKGETIETPAAPIDPDVMTAAEIKAEMKKKVGAPSKFKPEMIEQAEKLCALGLIDEEIAQFFRVTTRTLTRWKGRHPEFSRALKTGGAVADVRVERSLYKRATGFTADAVKIFLPRGSTEPVIVPYKEQVAPDTTACIFWLKNRRPDLWRDVNRHEHTGRDGGAIETSDKPEMDRARRLAILLTRSAEGGDATSH